MNVLCHSRVALVSVTACLWLLSHHLNRDKKIPFCFYFNAEAVRR